MEPSNPVGSTSIEPRRVFTTPTSSSSQQPPPATTETADGSVDTLYDHPSVKIVAFTAGPRTFSIGPRSGVSPPDCEPGTLAWSSQLERTIAVGPFRIYRAPGSVAFLSCGSALQPILPKSQAWCVDEESSKFVLQIRRPQYWRIEIPVEESEDQRRAQLLREVFEKILQFEKTACPFKRTFTVELPEPQTPTTKRPWTPVQLPPTLPPTPVTPKDLPWRRKAAERKASNVGSERPRRRRLRDDGAAGSPSQEEMLYDDEDGSDADSRSDLLEECDDSPAGLPEGPSREKVPRLSRFYSSRCATAPPQLMLNRPVRMRESTAIQEPGRDQDELVPQSPTESQVSFDCPQPFRSSSSPHQSPPLPPSPPVSHPASPFVPATRNDLTEKHGELGNQEDACNVSVVSHETGAWSVSSTASAPSELSDGATVLSSVCGVDCTASTCNAPALGESVLEEGSETSSAVTPASEDGPLTPSTSTVPFPSLAHSPPKTTAPRPKIRHRATTSSSISPDRRALSPLPPAADLFTPRPKYTINNSALAVVRRLPMAVIAKTCEILMSPPSYLINLMLRVAARILRGEWRGLVFGTDDHGEQIPVQWDWSDDEDINQAGSMARNRQLIDNDWPPRTGCKMAGSFPDSDDEDTMCQDGTPKSERGSAPSTPGGLESYRPAPPPAESDVQAEWCRSLGVD